MSHVVNRYGEGIKLPKAAKVLLPSVGVPFFAFRVVRYDRVGVSRRHVALCSNDRRELHAQSGRYPRISISFTSVSQGQETGWYVSRFRLYLYRVNFARNGHDCYAFVDDFDVVGVRLTNDVLDVGQFSAFGIALDFRYLYLVFFRLYAYFVYFYPMLLLIGGGGCLIFVRVNALYRGRLFRVAFCANARFGGLLNAGATCVLAVGFCVVFCYDLRCRYECFQFDLVQAHWWPMGARCRGGTGGDDGNSPFLWFWFFL